MNLQDLQQPVSYAAIFTVIRRKMQQGYPKDTPLTLEGLQTVIVEAATAQAEYEERQVQRKEREHKAIMSTISFFGQD